jgi:hypothetical protein
MPGSWTGAGGSAAFPRAVEIGFKTGEGCIQHFPPRHDDDVIRAGWFVTPEDFARQALGAIAFDGVPHLTRGGYAEAGAGPRRGEQEHGHEAPGDPCPLVVHALELGPAPDALGRPQALSGHYSSATVRRFRPFVRRRFSTIRPFLVDIRTRNPCVFFRRRVFG